MKRPIIYLFLVLVLFGLTSAQEVEAENIAEIEQLQVALWPDYDRPAILVIYRVQIAADADLPAEVQLPMPREAGDPYAVAWLDESGRLLVADYVRQTQGEWTIITLTSNSFVAQLEFYVDYEVSDSMRSATFIWPEGFAVEKLSYEVQQPIAVDDLELIPNPDRSYTGNDGLLYYQADLGQVSETQSARIEISYSNLNNELTADAFVTPQPLPLSSGSAAEGSTPDLGQIFPWLLGGLGFCLIVLGGILYFQSRRKLQRAKKRPSTGTRVEVFDEGSEADFDPSTIYCHQCGTKASVSDRYCRHCGVQLRR